MANGGRTYLGENHTGILTFEVQGITHTVILNLDGKTMRLIIPESWQPSGGEWRHLLTPRQIAEMNTLLGPILVKWGYTV